MEQLGRSCRVDDKHVVAGAELQIALNAGAGMFSPLALVAVRQKHGQPAGPVPLGAAAGDKLVDDNLGAVGKIAELRFPDGQSFGKLEGVAVFEAENSGFGQRAVVDTEEGIVGDRLQRRIRLAVG